LKKTTTLDRLKRALRSDREASRTKMHPEFRKRISKNAFDALISCKADPLEISKVMQEDLMIIMNEKKDKE